MTISIPMVFRKEMYGVAAERALRSLRDAQKA